MEIIDDAQFNELVKLHKKFIFGVAKKYSISNELDKEIEAAGLIGFYNAYKNYNPSLNTKLLTYSYNYIKYEVIRWQNEIKQKYFSDSQLETFQKIDIYLSKNFRDYLSEIDLEPLSVETGIDSEDILNFYAFGRATLYLDDIANNDSQITKTYYDYTEQKIFKDASYDAEVFFLRKVVNKWVEKLTEKEQIVLNGLFGLNSNDEVGFLELSIELNVSTVRIGQIRDQAIYKLNKDSKLEQIYNDHFK